MRFPLAGLTGPVLKVYRRVPAGEPRDKRHRGRTTRSDTIRSEIRWLQDAEERQHPCHDAAESEGDHQARGDDYERRPPSVTVPEDRN